MAYNRVNWQNSPSHATPLSAENLNVMDEGIKNLDDSMTEATGDITTLETTVGGHTTSIGTLANLTTTEKSNLVGAINEVDAGVSDVKEDLNSYINGGFIDVESSFTDGGYISASNGNLISYAHWKYTDYIDISERKNNSIYAYTTAPDNRYYNAYYDENKTFISSFEVTNAELTPPTNAKYVRMSIQEAYNCGVRIYKKGIEDELYNTLVTDTASGAIASFIDGADNVPVKNLKVNIETVQSGSGDPSPDNVRPIIGQTQVVVTRTGKNLFEVASNNKWLNGSGAIIDDLDSAVSQKISLVAGIMLTLSTAEAGNALAMCFYDASGTLLQRTAQGDVKSITTISPPGTSYMYAGRYKKAGGENVLLEVGSTASTYEPYHGQTVTIDLGGTRYGGSLDVTTGALTVDMAFIASYNGETLPSTWISDRDVYAAGTTPTTGAQVCYKLATPQTIQLTVNDDITTVLGQNNIWNDCGDTEVEYRADTNINTVKNNTDIIELNKEMEPFVQSLPTGYPENAKTYFSATHKPLSFVHFSDIHNVPVLWRRVAEYVGNYSAYLPFALHTGDYVGDNQTSYTDLYAYYMPSVPFLNCVGNHDTYANAQHTTATKQSVYEKLFNHTSDWDVTFMSGDYSMTYYKDFTDSNIRLIVFDNYYDIATQKTWLANILADAKSHGYHVITASHQVTGRPQSKVNCTFETLIPYESAGSGSLLNTEFDAVIGDFISNGGNHIVHLCGHEHSDNFYKTANGVLNYSIECATDYAGWTEGARVAYTKSWDCFNAISADTDLGILKIVRIGHNVDCFNRAKNILSYDYVNGTVLNNE